MSNSQYHEPWEQDTYQTGKTQPPKNHNGIIAALLVVVILLCGIITALGVLNIRLFRQVNGSTLENTVPISFSHTSDTKKTDLTSTTDPALASEDEAPIVIQDSPQGAENIPQSGGLSLQDIYTKAIDSVVSIACTYHGGSSSGTGVVLTANGYLVTNCHVVEKAASITAQFTDGRTMEAALVGMDEASDLAVLKVDATDLIPASVGNSSSLRVGDLVVAIGDPLGIELRGTMTDGIVSAINRDIVIDGRTMTVIQTNAALNSGNSGGPLLNCYGQVIGINTMKIGDYMSSAGVEGLGFAIPSTTMKDIVNQLIQQGYVSGRPAIGIEGESVSPFYQLYYRLPEGLYITNVTKGSSAEQAGISPGDILISMDSTRITSAEDLKTALYSYEAGDYVTLTIYRSGKRYQVQIVVDEAK